MTNVATKWYATKGGKIGIFAGLTVLTVGTILLVRYFKNNSPEKKLAEMADKIKDQVEKDPELSKTTENKADLPNGGIGCGEVKTSFDRTYNYVKCDGVWYTISKDRSVIPTWKSLADNKTATDLLNNKYPS